MQYRTLQALGLATAIVLTGPTAGATAASERAREVGVSPATDVVSIAPMAVSVTFDGPLSRDGARMRIIGRVGDVGDGPAVATGRTLRRELAANVLGGPYTVEWAARDEAGHRLSGSFQFIAARGHGDQALAARPSGSAAPGTSGAAGPTPSTAESEDAGTGATAEPGPTTPSPSPPSPSPSPPSSPPSETPQLTAGGAPGADGGPSVGSGDHPDSRAITRTPAVTGPAVSAGGSRSLALLLCLVLGVAAWAVGARHRSGVQLRTQI